MKTKLKIKQEEGITLIALVVTIVVLLILAGISLNLVLGQNGVIGKAKDVKNLTEKGQAQDEVNLAINYLQIEDATSTLTQEDKRKILEDELRKISADSSVSISGDGFKIIHKKYEFFVDEDLNVSDSEKEFDATEWDKKAAPEDIFIWKSDDPNNADYGVVIGYKKNVDNYTILRFPSRCTKVTSESNVYTSGVYNDTEDDEKTIRSYTKNILKVELPDTVKELGSSAFTGGNNVSFSFFSLERVELSKSLSKIEDSAFSECKNLKYIEIPESITEIGTWAFYGCNAIESITIPEGVKKIGEHCFSNCTSLQEINLSEGIKEIGDSSFYYCLNLQQINLPEGLENIGYGAFSYTSLERVKLPESLSKIGSNTFSNCKKLRYIEIPENVTEIGDSTFSGCEKLNIEIPDNITKIGSSAFSGCKAIESITIPAGVKEIGRYSFADCTNLQQINLPEGFEKIGEGAFANTNSLSEIIIPESVKTIDKYAFSGWTASQTIKCKATKAGDNWDKYWNYNSAYYFENVTKISANIIWGYQDDNT